MTETTPSQRVPRRRPRFVVKESKFSARVKSRWRYPRGKHSKVRQQHSGRPALPQPGYGAPAKDRGKDRSGLFPVVVSTKTALLALDSKVEAAVIGGTVGNKKRLALLQLAAENKITVIARDASTLVKQLEEKFATRVAAKKDREAAQAKKVSEKKKAAAKKEKETAALKEEKTADEKAKEEKQALEKTITKRQ